MRSIPFVAALFVLVVLRATAVGQQKILSEEDFNAAVESAFDVTSQRVRRVTKTIVSFTEGRQIGSEVATEEFVPSEDSWRVVRVLRAGPDATSFEVIEVGDAKYKRANQDIWSKWHRTENRDFTTVTYEGFSPGGAVAKYTAQSSVLAGNQVVLYSKVTNFDENSGSGTVGFGIEEIWVTLDGHVLRILATESEQKPIWTKRTEISYEYDPKDLKIEPPIKE